MNKNFIKACVIGGGSWGSAFAIHLGQDNIETRLWIREKEVYEEALRYRENKTFLPGSVFPSSVSFFNDLEEAIDKTEILFIAVPSKFCRSIYEIIAPSLSSDQIVVSLTKGIEENSLKRMSEIMDEVFNPSSKPYIAVLSGPSFAREVADSHPTAVVVSSKDQEISKKIQHLISNVYFRAYTTDDIVGVELAGALKNITAIATGISSGLEFGYNSIAALITRGITEIMRLGVKLGARAETFSGLAGIGDLVLTCTGHLSRNRYVGYELGKGKRLGEIVAGMKMIAEGITTTVSAHQLAKETGVEMPISEEVYQILYKNKDPRAAFQHLMSRKLKDEFR